MSEEFVKLCDQDPDSLALAAKFDAKALAEYQLPPMKTKSPRVIIIRQFMPTRKGRDGDGWLCSKPDWEGERLHLFKRRRKQPYKPVVKPTTNPDD